MSKVVLYIAASLDGYIADEDGGIEWLETFEDTYDAGEPGGSFEAFFEGVDCIVVGANTYEQVLGFDAWPYGDTPTVVTTRRDLHRVNESVECYDGAVEELARDVTSEHDLVWLVGGAALARSFLREGAIDEIRLSIIPRLLGDGIELFGGSGIDRALHLTDETAYENGIVELQYEIRSV
jgi:dihydrofolate reductase